MSSPNPQTTMDRVRAKVGAFFEAVFSLPAMLFVLLLAALVFIYNTATKDPSRIANVDYARGLITLLFAVGTIAIALVLTFAAVFQEATDSKERFERGRDVLGVLIGIFGTIVGFYFGSGTAGTDLAVAPTMTSVSPTSVDQNAETQLTITGTQFTADCIVLFGSHPLTPSNQTSTQLRVAITKEHTAVKDNLVLKVLDTATDRISNTLPFEVK